MKTNIRLCMVLVMFTWVFSAEAVVLDFEGLPDLTSVNDFYAADGVHFSNAISLTAGFSLNEFDYPPSSGIVAVGDDFAPIEITFDGLASNIAAFFTYASQLTFSAYDMGGALSGTYINPGLDNLGGTELIVPGFSGVKSMIIAGEWDGSYIMDDLSFTLAPSGTVPEPATYLLLLAGISGIMLGQRR